MRRGCRRFLSKWSPYRAQHFRLLAVPILLCSVALFITFGYVLLSFIYRFTGEPPQSAAHVLSGVAGFLLIGIASKLFVAVHQHRQHKYGRQDDIRTHMLDQTLEAMNRIAHGDFSVLVPVDKHDPFYQLNESVNKMARELGSMETMRQDFITNVSHEIQSPLTSISGFAALLKNDALPSEQRVHYLEIIETEAKRLSRLSEHLLKLSSLESSLQTLSATSFSLSKQIENTVLMLEPQWAAKNLNLDLSLEKITFIGDEALFSQVWINLLHNAIKFTPENGNIQITLFNTDNQTLCYISDTGIGIPPKDQIHIFERFYKADKSRDHSLGGNGLGLSLVKKIVELHGGNITVQSETGKGTTFTVTLINKKGNH